MAKRLDHPSDLDFSDITWEMVFERAGIPEDNDVAQRLVVTVTPSTYSIYLLLNVRFLESFKKIPLLVFYIFLWRGPMKILCHYFVRMTKSSQR